MQKRTLLCLTVLTVLLFAFEVGCCQISKGNYSTGMFLGFENPKTNFNAVSINPSCYYFVSNRFSAGIIIPISQGQTEGLSFVYDKVQRYVIGPSFRYYFPFSSKFYLFPQFDFTYGIEKIERESDIINDTGSYTSSSSVARLGLNLTYLITTHVGLEAGAYLQSSTSKYHSEGPTLLANFSVGVEYYIFKE